MNGINKIYQSDIIKTFGLIIFSIVAAYFFSGLIKSILYLIILYKFYNSKRDYIYLALVFFIIDAPSLMFYNVTEDIVKISIIRMSFAELFAFVAIYKYYREIRGLKLLFKTEYRIYLAAFIFFIIYGFQFGMTIKGSGENTTGLGLYRAIIKVFIFFSLFLTVPIILESKEKLIRFLYIIFSFTILNFIIQLGHVIVGGESSLHQFLSGQAGSQMNFDFSSSRPVFGAFITFIAFTTGLYFSLTNSIFFKKNHLNIIITTASFSIIIGVTRGWMISFAFILLFSYLLNIRKAFLTIVKRGVPLIIILFIILQISAFKKQAIYIIERFSTVELLIDGDLTAGGTNSRLTDRSIPVMDQFLQRPILGWGISGITYENYDPHVGNQSMLMSSGVIGLTTLILLLIFNSYKIVIKYKLFLGKTIIDAKKLFVFVISTLGLFIIHSSSTDMFGFMTYTYGYHANKLIFLSIYFSIINNLINFNINDYNQKIHIRNNK